MIFEDFLTEINWHELIRNGIDSANNGHALIVHNDSDFKSKCIS